MRWWLKSVHAPLVLAAGFLLGVLSSLTLGTAIGIPVIDDALSFGRLPFAAILPLIAVVLTGAATSAASTAQSATAVRSHMLFATGFTVVAATVFALGYLVIGAVSGTLDDLSAVRNGYGITALLFIGQAALGMRNGALVPSIVLVVGTIFGRVRGEIQPWAWPVTTATVADALLACGVAIVCALAPLYAARRAPVRMMAGNGGKKI